MLKSNYTRDFFIIFVVAILLRLVFSFAIAERVGEDAFEDLRLKSDSGQYVWLAKSILHDRTFTLYGYPHSFRTPGYPAWLAFWYWLSGSWFFAVAVIGSILGALTACFIYLVGRKIFSRNIALASAFLFALEPYGAHMAARPMTESLYALLIILSAFFVIKFYTSYGKRTFLFIILAGVVVGLAIWVRPQMWPFFVAIATIVFLLVPHQAGLTRKSSILFLLTVLLVVSPWFIRNTLVWGETDISSQGGWNLYFYHVKRFIGAERLFGLEGDELVVYLSERLGYKGPDDIRSIVYQPIYYKEAFRVIAEKPFRYALWHAKESLVFFYDDGLRDMLRHVAIDSDFAFSDFRMNSPLAFLIPAFVFGWVLLFSLAGYGVWHGFKNPALRPIIILFAIMILYVPAVAGTLAVARFRFPLTPVLFLLSSYGFSLLWQRRRKIE